MKTMIFALLAALALGACDGTAMSVPDAEVDSKPACELVELEPSAPGKCDFPLGRGYICNDLHVYIDGLPVDDSTGRLVCDAGAVVVFGDCSGKSVAITYGCVL